MFTVSKTFAQMYWDNFIEKSGKPHKYIRKIPKKTGKGYYYLYPKDFKNPRDLPSASSLANEFIKNGQINLAKEEYLKVYKQTGVLEAGFNAARLMKSDCKKITGSNGTA